MTSTMLDTINPGTSVTTSTSIPLTFEDVAKLFTEKANAIVGKWKLSGPGSEFANAAITPPPFTSKINTTMGLCTGTETTIRVLSAQIHFVQDCRMLRIMITHTAIGLEGEWRARLQPGFVTGTP